jgi:hypothetical protein
MVLLLSPTHEIDREQKRICFPDHSYGKLCAMPYLYRVVMFIVVVALAFASMVGRERMLG